MTIAVVGAGPAGLIVATVLARRGQTVTLIDEHATAGGHLTYDEYPLGASNADSGTWLTELRSALESSEVSYLASAVAWAAFRAGGGFELAVHHSGVERSVRADQLVVAAGTTDLPLVAPGATLPGVMTGRAVRILLNRHGVIAGQRFAIVGTGIDADRLRHELTTAGCEVIATLAPENVSAISGEGGVQSILCRDGESHPVDVVVVARGEVPDLQLAGMLELPRLYDPTLCGWRIVSDRETEGVHVVGGALLGPARPAEVVQSAMAVIDRMSPAGTGLRDVGLVVTGDILGTEAMR